MSAVTDALRAAIEALSIDDVESEVDELRSALDTARSTMKDAVTAIRETLGKVQAVAATVRQLCERGALSGSSCVENAHRPVAFV
jgi:hypothetical protein